MRVGERIGTRGENFSVELNTREALLSTVEPAGADDPRTRLKDHTIPPFQVEKNPMWLAHIDAASTVIEDWEDSRDGAMLAHYLEFAEGKQLDYIGRKYFVPRRNGEVDSLYKIRILLSRKTVTAGGTVDDFKEVSATALETSPEAIDVAEPYQIEPARVDITLPLSMLERSRIGIDDYLDALQSIKAAGVKLNGFATAGFTHRSEDDFEAGRNDPSKGYNSLDGNGNPKDLGGGYASLFV